jgi:hypothetical protein
MKLNKFRSQLVSIQSELPKEVEKFNQNVRTSETRQMADIGDDADRTCSRQLAEVLDKQ